ncbi:MAG TPA: CHASE2 domain-containing protein [Burkholderiales bacterium]|nr:CHASE2 domain-containing protein [Burkholderiales bacterium]
MPEAQVPARGWRGLLGRERVAGVAVLALLLVLAAGGSNWQRRIQLAWFDSYQVAAPRQVGSMPAIVVAIDEKSLAELGQWPWPRTVMADLVKAINRAQPAAIGIDVLMPEPDRMSPAHLLGGLPVDADLARRIAALPDNDAVLAQALAGAPVVLGIAGMPEATGRTLRAVPMRVRGGDSGPGLQLGLRQYAGVMTSLDELDRAAPGHGLLSAPDTDSGVVRSVPLVASVDGTLAPALSMEMLRVATGMRGFVLGAQGAKLRSIGIADLTIPTAADGVAWVHFSPRDSRRLVSASDVLAGRVPAERLAHKLVLIGATGLGLLDNQATPIGVRMPGIEIHAQLLENLFDSTWLTRPEWAAQAEFAALLLLGMLLIVLVPALTPRLALVAGGACIAALLAGGFGAYLWARLLLDAATPAMGLLLLFGALLASSLSEATRRRRALELEVQAQREHAARVDGELQAAQRIQTAILPRADALAGEARIELAASMTPAREVGGDLYDFYMLDADRLLFLIGDVSGKGLGASMFMAVSKALCKSVGLRGAARDDPAGTRMTQANREVSRENPESMFVTVFAGILDLASGEVAYCNAGHDNPYVLRPGSEQLRRLADGDGPPLCVIDDFAYIGASHTLAAGEMLCLITDGVTEAQTAAGELYGGTRLQKVLEQCAQAGQGCEQVLAAVQADVAAFTGPVEPADDLTLLVLRWRGPGAAR